VVDRTWVAAAAFAIAALGALLFLWPEAATVPEISVSAPIAMSGVVTVHVSGSVSHPGLIALERGARIADAVAAAGGALPGADLSALNLAATVIDGQQLVVPDSSGGSATAIDGRVRVNTADAAGLETLPGVGPVLAQRIVEYRELHGSFLQVEDLLDVPGIGEAKLAAMRESVIVP
jgi:competence protein ComEA